MPDSLWRDHLTPNVSPIPLRPHHMLPTPTKFIFAHVTSVLGTAEQSSRCHGSWWREPAHWLLVERRKKKAHGVRGRVPSACLPLFSVSCWLGHINGACCHGQGPAGTMPQLCTCRVEWGPPRSMSLVSPSSVKCVKDKSRAHKEKWAAFSFTLNSFQLSFLL